ncbi:MAG: hypothetical protein PHF51_02895 [Candidatus ainarchaeum sp.]|nr:hypothetical protein [Candidatus ainarchaeum sp.]
MDVVSLVSLKGARAVHASLERFPGRQFTISELARVSGIPFSSAWNIVKAWERAGIVDTGRVGRAVTVRLSGSEVEKAASRVLKAGVSPQALALEWLRGRVSGERAVRSASVFGSVGAGEERLESDLDLAVLARKGFDATPIAVEACERFRAKVVPIVFSDEEEFSSFLAGKRAVRLK